MKTSYWLAVSLFIVGLDQVSKLLMVEYVPTAVVYNDGSAFSLPVPQLLTIVASFAIMFFAIWFKEQEGRWFIWSLLFAGAFGNLIDRLSYGHVIDFIDVGFWPVFNFADIYLSLAGIMLVWFYVIRDNKANS